MKRTLRLSIWIPLGALLVLGPARGARAAARPADASAAPGTVPAGINYQGRLVDNGFPVTATRSLTFRLYDAPTGGSLLWTSAAQSVAVNQGIFGTTLSISTPALAGAAQKYLEVQVDNTVLSPREPLQAVPYALIAKSVEDNLALQTLTAASSVTASAFFGDGSHLSGVSGSLTGGAAGYVTKWSGPTTLALSNFWETASSDTVLGAGGLGVASSATASAFFGDGSHLTGIPSTGSFSGVYLPLSGGALNPGAGLALSGAGGTIASQSSATASAFFGDGSHLTGIAALSGGSAGYLPKWTGAASEGLSNFWETASSDTVLGPGGLSVNYGLAAGSITLTGAGGTITSASSATAAAFFGDGSHLTGIAALSGGAAGYLPKWTGAASEGLSSFWETASSDTVLGPGGLSVNYGLAAGSITLTGAGGTITSASSATAAAFFGDGSHLTGIAALSGGTAGYLPKWTGAASEGLSNFWETASSDTVLGSGGLSVNYGLAAGSITLSGANGTITSASSVTASAFFGDGSHLSGVSGTDVTRVAKTGDAMTGPLTMASASTITVSGNAFSVGGATFVVTNGNVGIGTASPATQLHMSSGTLTIDGNAATGLQVYGSTFVVNASGNVGIGTSSPGKLLDMQSSAAQTAQRVWNTGSGISYTQWRNASGSAAAGVETGTSGTAFLNTTPYAAVFGNQNAYPAQFATNNTVRATIDAGGNLGVGTTSPAATLDVNGAAQFGSGVNKSTFSAAGGLTFAAGFAPSAAQDAATKNYVDTKLVSGGGPWTQAGAVVSLTTPSNNAVVQSTLTVQGNAFSVGGSTFVVSGGNVGIGTTAPASKLDVAGTVIARSQTTGGPSVQGFNTLGNRNMNLGNMNLDNAGIQLFLADGATENDRIFSNGSSWFNGGYVGIGTASPATKLHLSSGTLTVDGNASTGLQVFGSTFVVNSSGYVGIGTSTPAAALDVYGGIASRYGTSAMADSFWGGFGDVVLRLWNHTTETVDINSNGNTYFNGGNVGIGTTSPNRPLAIFSSRVNPYATNTYVGIDDIWLANFTTTNHNTGLAMATNANGGGGTVASVGVVATGTVSGSALVFQTRSDAAVDGERMRIDQNGSVGVGTTSPAATLDVNGAIRAGTTGAACSALLNGALRFNSSANDYELCYGAGAAWLALEPAYAWADVAASATAVKGGRYLVNTSGGAVTLTLPAAPAAGDRVAIVDSGGAFATNNLTVARNGSNIMALAQDMTVSTNYVSFELVYDGAANGWRIK